MNSYIQNLSQALAIEKKHDRESFNALNDKLSLHDKVQNGMCWYPLLIKETGYTVGEYPYITVEIDRNKLVNHAFKAGAIIKFFSNANNASGETTVNGTVHYAFENQMKIVLNTDELPDWYDMGKVGVQIEFDEKSYQEMEKSLKSVLQSQDKRIEQLIEIISGKRACTAHTIPIQITNKNLNASQIAAVQGIVDNQEIAIVHGPPGTGKTTTLIEAIIQTVILEKQVLVTAPSNTAVDLLVEKLAIRGINVIRLGNVSRIDEAVMHHTIDYLVANSKEATEIKRLKKESAEYKRMANKYKRSFGPSEREQRRLLVSESKEIMKQARMIEDFLLDKFIADAQVICTTLVGCETNYLKGKKFKTCFIDEAAQALEPATWIPILKSEKVVLSGDPFQLPPTVKSNEAIKMGLSRTLMERCLDAVSSVYLLDTQYRMNEKLMGYSNAYFYQNQLKAHDSVRWNYFTNPLLSSLLFIDTAGCGYEEVRAENSDSLCNPEEYMLLFKHLEKTMLEMGEDASTSNVGIISPYRGQVKYMRENDVNDLQLTVTYPQIHIQTIDAFQGQERDIIYISLVRSNTESEIGFLKDYRRMNVAMTRAKKMLVVIGDSATLGDDAFYKGFIDYCHEHDGYKSAWEFI